ncbi:MAG: WD40 repeat domain-containing protein, partial [Chloroflexi bacterium]
MRLQNWQICLRNIVTKYHKSINNTPIQLNIIRMITKYLALSLLVILLSAFIPFDDFDGRIDSGWFTLSHDGRYAAVVSVPDTLIVIDLQTGTEAQRVIFPGEVITAEFAADGRLGVITAQDAEFGVWTYDLAADVRESVGTLDEPPVRVWISEVGDVWVEVLTQQAYILNMMTGERLPSAPYADSTAVMRNGRTAAPFAVTSTADGLIKLWHLETGTELGHVQLEMVPDFGRVNDMSGHYLAVNVRARSEVLLLDFDQSAVIARLPVPNGAYIHGLMVMPGGEQVVGVQFDDEPIVGLWDVTTGQFTNLGTFHPCSRVPDLMRLSGTTLVIGCGEGLDVWQLSDMNAPEIRLDNVQHLQSVSHIDFSDFGTFRTGAFSVSPNGEYAAVIDST